MNLNLDSKGSSRNSIGIHRNKAITFQKYFFRNIGLRSHQSNSIFHRVYSYQKRILCLSLSISIQFHGWMVWTERKWICFDGWRCNSQVSIYLWPNILFFFLHHIIFSEQEVSTTSPRILPLLSHKAIQTEIRTEDEALWADCFSRGEDDVNYFVEM